MGKAGQVMVGQEWVTKAIILGAIIEYWFALFGTGVIASGEGC